MAPPLIKKDMQGDVYARPPSIEAQIDEVANLSPPELKRRLDVKNSKREGFLHPETLVHLLRRGIVADNNETINAVLPVLLNRCEQTLERKIFDSLPGAVALREDILGSFAELLASDHATEVPGELDFYECKFNAAFQSFYIVYAKREATYSGRFAAVETEDELDETPIDEMSPRDISEALHHDTPEGRLRLKRLLEAIESLPKKERDAVVLVFIMDYKEESNDPDEETAATKCNCTGRTIRNRLASAVKKLARFQEDK